MGDSRRWAAAFAGIVIGCMAGLALAFTGMVEPPGSLAPLASAGDIPRAGAPGGSPPDADVAGDGAHSRFAILARAIAPGVVNVHTSKTVTQQFPDLGPFGDLFGGLFGDPPGRAAHVNDLNRAALPCRASARDS
jgi:S1-C subfamily serine protease